MYSISPAYSVEAQASGVHGYALILLVTVVEAKYSVISGHIRVRCCPVRSGAVNSHTQFKPWLRVIVIANLRSKVNGMKM